jgi:hypothetical protein
MGVGGGRRGEGGGGGRGGEGEGEGRERGREGDMLSMSRHNYVVSLLYRNTHVNYHITWNFNSRAIVGNVLSKGLLQNSFLSL